MKGVYQPTWVCATHKIEGYEGCSQKYLTEKSIEDAFIAVSLELLGDMQEIRKTLNNNVIASLSYNLDEKLLRITEAITSAQNKMLMLVKDKRNGVIGDEEYAVQGNEIAKEIDRLSAEKTALETDSNTARINNKRVEEILDFLSGINPTSQFDAEVFKAVVDEIIVKNETTLEFHFKIGTVKSITIERK